MSEQTDRNQQALSLTRQPGYTVTEWRFGFTVARGCLHSEFFGKEELTPATTQTLHQIANQPGHNPTKPKPRRYVSRRRKSAAAVLNSAFGAMAELTKRVNQEKGQ